LFSSLHYRFHGFCPKPATSQSSRNEKLRTSPCGGSAPLFLWLRCKAGISAVRTFDNEERFFSPLLRPSVRFSRRRILPLISPLQESPLSSYSRDRQMAVIFFGSAASTLAQGTRLYFNFFFARFFHGASVLLRPHRSSFSLLPVPRLRTPISIP